MNPHLFVYGTLLSTGGHPKGARLQREARLIGEASITGQLYRIESYPGLVEDSDPQLRVHGEVYALNDPAGALKWLDAYEGIVPGNEAAGEYQRMQQPVRLATNAELAAWVYLYRNDVTAFTSVPDGRWTATAP